MPIPTLTSSLKLRSQTKTTATQPEQLETPRDEAHNHESADAHSTSKTIGDEQKRRSFLPQRGIPKSIFRNDASTEAPTTKSQHRVAPVNTKETAGTQPSRPRPRSLYQTRTASQSATKETDEVQSNSSSDRTMKPPPPGPIQRSESVRRSTVSSQPTHSMNIRSHVRTRSTVTALPKGTREVAPAKERPKSLVIAPSDNTKLGIGIDMDHPTTAAPRASARLGAMKRSNSTRAKPEAVRDRTAITTEPAQSGISQAQARRHEIQKEEPRKLARPAFSTLQQHFTPRKTGKAATSTFLHPAPEVTTTHLPPDITSLQSELLQLHLLHAASAQTSRQWELSAQKSLREKFDEVTSLYQAMRQYERHGVEQKNLQALREWDGATSLPGLTKNLQALSGPLNEVPILLDSGGRYDDLVHQFGQWMDQVEDIWSSRNSHTSSGLNETGSLEGLGDWWKEENQVLTRKLTSFLRDLDSLQAPVPGSSIAYIVAVCTELLEGLVAELKIMQTINSDVVAKEEQWVEDRLRMIAQDIGVILQNSEEEEAWRS